MTTTAWAHLPNAAHLDRVLASVKKNPEKWSAAWYAAGNAAGGAAWDAAWGAVRGAVRGAAWDAARAAAGNAAGNAAWDATRGAAWGAAIALIAWDDCAYMLELPEDVLKLLRAVGNEQAILLSVAAHALRETSC